MRQEPPTDEPLWNTGTHLDFFTYYEQESASAGALRRFETIRKTVLRMIGGERGTLDVADIGCGAGTQCRLWAAHGHRVHGADINAALIALAQNRARDANLDITFEVASATSLPWDDASMDVCIAPELLEHVEDWQGCLSEFVRVLRPGGVLYLSTSNKLCPMQEEFTLPMYSWYPGWVKRRAEQLARTTRPELAGYATYPAVNWFTFSALRAHLERMDVRCLDRFDVIDTAAHGRCARAIVVLLRRVPVLRFLGHVATPYTMLLGFKQTPPNACPAGSS